MTTRIDHIVVGAASLEDGVKYVQNELGVAIPKGGEHPSMATHNHLMQLGNDTFLEVIAINPAGVAPQQPRWFGLDDPSIRASVAEPRLLTWVANTTDLDAMQSRSPINLGVITPLSRGELSWLFAVPDDGRLLASGLLPYVMQWKTDIHPSRNMADLQCRLKRIHVHHPYAAWYRSVMEHLDATELVEVHSLGKNDVPFLSAEIETPNGEVTLHGKL